MKEFIEKLIGRLEEKSVEITFPLYPDDSTSFVPITEAIKIVNQLAEEYEEECEYKENFAPSGSIYFLTGCGTRHNGYLDKNRPYCGFCGKKIKIAPYQPKGE